MRVGVWLIWGCALAGCDPAASSGGVDFDFASAEASQPADFAAADRAVADPDAGDLANVDAARDLGLPLDPDGVVMLYPPAPGGTAWHLGSGDPNAGGAFFDLDGDSATSSTENGVTYWTTHGHKITYASGAPDGITMRLDIIAAGDTQLYDWQNGALAHGYLGSPADLKNLEATVYVRVHTNNGTHTSMSWKIHGGRHTGSHDPRASCAELEVPYGGVAPKAARELNHPDYDYLDLTARFPYQVSDGKWLAVKIVSYFDPDGKSTHNALYLDTDPFDAAGRPANHFQLYSEWDDVDGQSTGMYTQAALWAGWVTTFRVDGWQSVDFAILSAREILPPG